MSTCMQVLVRRSSGDLIWQTLAPWLINVINSSFAVEAPSDAFKVHTVLSYVWFPLPSIDLKDG